MKIRIPKTAADTKEQRELIWERQEKQKQMESAENEKTSYFVPVYCLNCQHQQSLSFLLGTLAIPTKKIGGGEESRAMGLQVGSRTFEGQCENCACLNLLVKVPGQHLGFLDV